MNLKSLAELGGLLPEHPVPASVRNTSLATPEPFLEWLEKAAGKKVDVDEFNVLQPWCICALAAFTRRGTVSPIALRSSFQTRAGNFANRLGLFSITDENESPNQGERGRTLTLHRLKDYADIDELAKTISDMAILAESTAAEAGDTFDPVETRQAIEYIVIELLRNVVQHSGDPLGAVVLAQRMDRGSHYSDHVCIQIAVADQGIGILESLKDYHPDVTNQQVALKKAISPFTSGTFRTGEKAGPQNAGMGLFIVSEMAKRTSGRFMISTRGASLLLTGDEDDEGTDKIDLVGQGFPGTLVVFEMPRQAIQDYDSLLRKIKESAYRLLPKRKKIDWIKFSEIDPTAQEFVVNIAGENTVKAEEYSKRFLVPRVSAGIPITLNFAGKRICTQSFLHALLYSALQIAYEKQVQIYAKNAKPAVIEGIHMLEWYTLE